jgi:hypothetical protein
MAAGLAGHLLHRKKIGQKVDGCQPSAKPGSQGLAKKLGDTEIAGNQGLQAPGQRIGN